MSERREQMDKMDTQDILLWRINRLNPNTESEKLSTFQIRGHHLKHYFCLHKGMTPYELAQNMTGHIIKSTLGNRDGSYTNDIVGPSPKDRLVYETLLQDVFEQYSNLDKNTLVVINWNKDSICASCKTGEHCDLWKEGADLEDSHYAAAVLNTIISLGLAGEVEIETKNVVLDESYFEHTHAVLGFKTKKWVLDKAMNHLAKNHEILLPMSDSTYGILPELEQISEYRKFIRSLGFPTG